MKELWRFIKSSGIYFVGTVMTKLISFLLLPLYTKCISPEDYGIYDLHNAYVMFFCSVLYLDIWAGIMRFMYDYTGDEKKKPISSGIAIFCCSTILYTITLAIAVGVLGLRYPVLLFFYGLLMNLQTLVGYIARGYGKNVLYTVAGIVGSFITVLFNIILLVYFKMNYSALFLSSCIGYLINILIIVIGVKVPGAFSIKYFDKKVFKDMLIFSLPLCLNSVAYWFLTSYNRVVIANELGDATNGFYAIAGRFGSMITLFTTCFQMAWQELAYSKTAKENDLDNFYTVAINNYIKCMGVGLVLLIPVINIIYPIIIHDTYNEGKALVPLYLLGTIFSTISSFIGNSFSAIKKNNLLFWTMLIGSVTNVACIHLLINRVGLQASNISLILGFLVICITRMILFRKYVKVKVDYVSILILFATFIGASYVYAKCNIWINMIYFVVALVVSLFVFRDVIKMMINGIKAKRNSKVE